MPCLYQTVRTTLIPHMEEQGDTNSLPIAALLFPGEGSDVKHQSACVDPRTDIAFAVRTAAWVG